MYEKFTIITLSNAGRGWSGSKKFKPIPTPPRGVRLKSCPIPAPPPLRGEKNLCGAKRIKRGGEKLPSLIMGNKIYFSKCIPNQIIGE